MNIEIKNTLLSPRARSFVLIAVFAVMFLILTARVFYLQIIKGEEYAENFRLQIKREITLHGTRGNIYDKNVKLLTGNKIVYKKSGIELTESSPQVTDSYAIPSAIGQGTNNFSTVQLGRYVTTLANRGTSFRLSLVDQIDGIRQEPEQESAVELPDEIWEAVHTGMEQYAQSTGIFEGFPIPAAGKSGTAQESRTRPDHGLFVGYAPADEPEIAVAVRIANGYEAGCAVECGREIFESYFNVGQQAEQADAAR